MPRPKSTVPQYRLHKGTGQAVAYLDGKVIYLGVHGSPKSKQRYADLLTRLSAGLPAKTEPTSKPASASPSPVTGRSVAALLLQYITDTLPKYAKDEQECLKGAIKIVNESFGKTPAAEFGPLRLRSVRQSMVDKGWSRSYINSQVKRVRRIFRWGVSWEFIPSAVADALSTVESLKAGETDAPEPNPRRAISPERLAAVKAKLNERQRDIFDLLLLTGARPSEILGLTTGSLSRGDDVWRADLSMHKTAHKGKSRTLFFNVTAQAILMKYLQADPAKRLFPIRRDTFGQMVRKACERAFDMPDELRKPDPNLSPAKLAEIKRQAKAWRRQHCYSPHWLRHTVATRLANEVGIEAAQRLLGHTAQAMTEHYSRAADRVAIDAAKRLG